MSGLRTGVGGAADGAILIFLFSFKDTPSYSVSCKRKLKSTFNPVWCYQFVWIESCSCAYIAEMQC